MKTDMRYLFLLLFSLTFSLVMAQAPDHKAITSQNWKIVNELTYQMNGDGDFVPVFSENLKSVSGKVFELKGYMVPYEVGLTHSKFALSVLPISQCQFCGTGNIPPMVEVNMENPIEFQDKVITIKGKVQLNADNMEQLEIVLTDAWLNEE